MQSSSIPEQNKMVMPLKHWFEKAAKDGTILLTDWNSEPLRSIQSLLPVNEKPAVVPKVIEDKVHQVLQFPHYQRQVKGPFYY